MDHHECTTSGGVGCTSDETFSLIHKKINESEKVCFLLNMTLQKQQQIKSWRETRETICNSASDWSMGKTVKKIKIFFIIFLFSSLFFHRPIRSRVA
jgi:CRISPR/Cas system-associated protein Csx1